jgi:GDPmannose 4,6-dehydratase
MRRIADADVAGEYVVATGVTHTVGELAAAAFGHVGLDYRDYVSVDPKHYAPAEAVPLRGDISKIRRELGWKPEKGFSEIVSEMVDADLAALSGSRHDVASVAAS